MKEGEVMKEKNELDVLENAGESVTNRLTEEFPPRDKKQKEKIYSMSERKFSNRSTGTSYTDEQSVSGVEVYKRPKWQKILSIAAAFAVVVGGITGGTYAFRHFRNTKDISLASTPETEVGVAPFGDFAKLDYQLCDYSNYSEEIDYNMLDTITLPDTIEISQAKREKLAELFNNYDYESNKHVTITLQNDKFTITNEETGKNKVIDPSAMPPHDDTENEDTEVFVMINMMDNAPHPDSPYFIYKDSDEVRMLSFSKLADIGVIAYLSFNYEEVEGGIKMLPETAVTKGWKMDFDWFKTTITEILNSDDDEIIEETTEEPVIPVVEGNCPFDLASHDFFIPRGGDTMITVDPNYHDGKVAVFDPDTEGVQWVEQENDAKELYEFNTSDENIIPKDKRQQLSNFFNTLDWEETDDSGYQSDKLYWLYTNEKINFVNVSDGVFEWIFLDRDTDRLTYVTFDIELENDYTDPDTDSDDPQEKSHLVNYKAVGETDMLNNRKMYVVDYKLCKEKINEIIGDDYPVTPDYGFLSENWTVDLGDGPVTLSTEEKEYISEFLNQYQWDHTAAEYPHDTITAPVYAVFECDTYDYHKKFSLEAEENDTFAGYTETDLNAAPYNSINGQLACVCYDNTLVQKLKDYISQNHKEDTPPESSSADITT